MAVRWTHLFSRLGNLCCTQPICLVLTILICHVNALIRLVLRTYKVSFKNYSVLFTHDIYFWYYIDASSVNNPTAATSNVVHEKCKTCSF